jgi:hypothetical protein
LASYTDGKEPLRYTGGTKPSYLAFIGCLLKVPVCRSRSTPFPTSKAHYEPIYADKRLILRVSRPPTTTTVNVAELIRAIVAEKTHRNCWASATIWPENCLTISGEYIALPVATLLPVQKPFRQRKTDNGNATDHVGRYPQ